MLKSSLGWIPCLDGIRAVSIVFVLLAHFLGTVYRQLPEILLLLLKLGNLGVRVFFVVSAFLITSLLISQLYLNRTFGIFRLFTRS